MHRLMPSLAALLMACSAAPDAKPEFDPGQCRVNATAATLDAPIQGRLDGARGRGAACWALDVSGPGTLRVTLNLDRPEGIEAVRLRITDGIGRPLAQSLFGGVSATTDLTHAIEAPGRLIIELRSASGASSFGMQVTLDRSKPEADPSPVESPPAPPPTAAGGEQPNGKAPATRGLLPSPPSPPPPPPLPPPVFGTVVRVIPQGAGHQVTVQLAEGGHAVDWGGGIALVDGGRVLASATLRDRDRDTALLLVKGLTVGRIRASRARFTRAVTP